MTQTPAGESLPQVFDRIVASMGGVQNLVDRTEHTPEPPRGIVVEHVSGGITVTVDDGRVQSISIDPALGDARGADLLTDLQGAVNGALSEYERANFAQLEKVNSDFGQVMRQLGGLQADIHAAYRNDIERLRP